MFGLKVFSFALLLWCSFAEAGYGGHPDIWAFAKIQLLNKTQVEGMIEIRSFTSSEQPILSFKIDRKKRYVRLDQERQEFDFGDHGTLSVGNLNIESILSNCRGEEKVSTFKISDIKKITVFVASSDLTVQKKINDYSDFNLGAKCQTLYFFAGGDASESYFFEPADENPQKVALAIALMLNLDSDGEISYSGKNLKSAKNVNELPISFQMLGAKLLAIGHALPRNASFEKEIKKFITKWAVRSRGQSDYNPYTSATLELKQELLNIHADETEVYCQEGFSADCHSREQEVLAWIKSGEAKTCASIYAPIYKYNTPEGARALDSCKSFESLVSPAVRKGVYDLVFKKCLVNPQKECIGLKEFLLVLAYRNIPVGASFPSAPNFKAETTSEEFLLLYLNALSYFKRSRDIYTQALDMAMERLPNKYKNDPNFMKKLTANNSYFMSYFGNELIAKIQRSPEMILDYYGSAHCDYMRKLPAALKGNELIVLGFFKKFQNIDKGGEICGNSSGGIKDNPYAITVTCKLVKDRDSCLDSIPQEIRSNTKSMQALQFMGVKRNGTATPIRRGLSQPL